MRERNGLSSEGFVQALMNAFENGFIGRFVEIGFVFFGDKDDNSDAAGFSGGKWIVEGQLTEIINGGSGFDRFHNALMIRDILHSE